MSDLQIVLMIIGALIIAAVVFFNWWQERKFNRQVESSFSKLESDALLNVKSSVSSRDFSDDFSIGIDHAEPEFSHVNDESRYVHLEDDIANAPTDDATFDLEEAYIEAVHEHRQEVDEELASLNLDNPGPAQEDEPESPSVFESNVHAIKPTQREEIKAIFDEAFSHTKAPQESAEAKIKDKVKVNALDIEEPILGLPAMLHAQMDLTALIYLATDASMEAVSKSLKGLFDGYNKPVHLHVLDSSKQWLSFNDALASASTSGKNVSRIACSLQLADRGGAVSRSMLNRFQLAVETLGLDMNAHVEWQSQGDALATASALDAFCIDVDKTMGFHLVHGDNGAFTGTKLRGLAEAQGLVLDADGSFKYYDEATLKQMQSNTLMKLPPPTFVMFNRDQHPFSPEMLRSSVVKAVTFQLDIPHVKHCTEAFNHMVQIARQMEIGLNAILVDDNTRPLGDMQIEKIRHQLKVIHAKLLVRGIVPGSDSALRLFS